MFYGPAIRFQQESPLGDVYALVAAIANRSANNIVCAALMFHVKHFCGCPGLYVSRETLKQINTSMPACLEPSPG